MKEIDRQPTALGNYGKLKKKRGSDSHEFYSNEIDDNTKPNVSFKKIFAESKDK